MSKMEQVRTPVLISSGMVPVNSCCSPAWATQWDLVSFVGISYPLASWWLSGKESTCNTGDAGDLGSIPGLNLGAWQAIVYGVAESAEQLNMHTSYMFHIFPKNIWNSIYSLKKEKNSEVLTLLIASVSISLSRNMYYSKSWERGGLCLLLLLISYNAEPSA